MRLTVTELENLLAAMAGRATALDRAGEWPSDDLASLATIGAMRWAIAKQFGGDEVSPLELHCRYETIASASLAVALAISQRDSAVSIIEAGDNEALKDEWLPKFASGNAFTTIGIAQLTTSHQGGKPALVARRAGDGWILNGLVPWSTGADQSAVIVIGAAVETSRSDEQLLIALRANLSGVTIGEPMPLVALSASHTAAVHLVDVRVEDRDVIRGPAPSVLSGRTRTLPIGQAFLAMGLCRGAIELMRTSAASFAQTTADTFAEQLESLRAEVLDACAASPVFKTGATPSSLRGRCNDLAVRITQAAVAIFKGSGLLLTHPAQRLAREAMFLLVWSCPAPVVECTLERLSCVE